MYEYSCNLYWLFPNGQCTSDFMRKTCTIYVSFNKQLLIATIEKATVNMQFNLLLYSD